MLAWLELSAEPQKDLYAGVRFFRSTERAEMMTTIREIVEDARRRATSKTTPSREKVKWASLAGKLIWYNDQILRSLNYEALHQELEELKRKMAEREKQLFAPPSPAPRRMVHESGKH